MGAGPSRSPEHPFLTCLDWCLGPKGLWSWGVSSPSVVLMTLKAPLGSFIRVIPPDVMLMARERRGGADLIILF